MNMNDEIPISIEDDKLFTQIALVIDRPEIHRDLKESREKMQRLIGKTDLLTFYHSHNYSQFASEVEKIRGKHNLPPVFNIIISQALFHWKVNHSYISSSYPFGKSLKKGPILMLKGNEGTMYLPIKTFHYKYIGERGEVKRDRKWYWMWVARKRRDFEGICDEWNSFCPNPNIENHDLCKHCVSDVNKIQQAVSRYHRALISPLTYN